MTDADLRRTQRWVVVAASVLVVMLVLIVIQLMRVAYTHGVIDANQKILEKFNREDDSQ